MQKSEDIKQFHCENQATLLIHSEVCNDFHYHVNVILKLMTEIVTELVDIAHIFFHNYRFQCSSHEELKFLVEKPICLDDMFVQLEFDIVL